MKEIEEEIPFVPAFDLLEELERNPTPEELAAIAVALQHDIASKQTQQISTWLLMARFEGISQRLPQ